jgi:outer membrane biosynthesis protein TonB
MCTVLFLDIVEYSKKGVTEQLKIKQQFNTCMSAAIQDIAVNDRIILDTGDGVAVNFLGDPEDALFVAMNLSRAFASPPEGEPRVEVRTGINLGPVRLVRDINGQPNIIGDGINVAERVMSFARPGQVLVSRAYFEVVTRISEDYAQLFAYQGSRTDKHVREHEIYEIASAGGAACDLATRRHRARPTGRPALVDLAESTQAVAAQPRKAWLGNRALAYGAALVSSVALVAAVVVHIAEPGHKSSSTKTARPAAAVPQKPVEPLPPPVVAEATPPAVTEPEKPAEPAKPATRKAGKESSARKPTHAVRAEHPAAREPEAAPGRGDAGPLPDILSPWKAAVVVQPTPAPAPAPAQSPPRAPSGPTALVTLAVSPWGEVLVDGRSVGVSPPMTELELAPGTYRVEIRNGNSKPYQETLQLESNQTIRIKYKFR